MCCPSRCCCLCLLLLLAIIVVGFVFGFGIFSHGFHKIRDALHLEEPPTPGSLNRRPFLAGAAPPAF
ncbi:uncharacterized protein LOC122049362 [Zingiber officinale]|uniref:uncharacterized protein LOC122049362 n=1 Tax=Zingiber officinale TaxID=94328 RepID=UPI001C4D6B2A|nr:uncharacterized protein LOC122049362 [Zingiber officinale]